MDFQRIPTEEVQEEVNEKVSCDEGVSQNEADQDLVCGIGSFRPKFLQKFANSKVFLVLFCILGIIEGAAFTYMIGVLSSWEKRYAFDSKISGLILIADNISSIFISVIVGHYGSTAHRPRWIACGMMIVAFSCILSSSPYFIFGPGLHLLTSKIELNNTSYQMCKASDATEEICVQNTTATNVAILIFFTANFLNGFGYTAFYTVGTSYIDDSVKKKNSPIYFSTQMSVRLLGPSFGYVLASFSLRYYESPFHDPGIGMEDPRWVGAWWMGFIILGVLLFVFSVPMLLFPKALSGSSNSAKTKQISTKNSPKLKDIPTTFYRLILNPVWLFHTIAVIFHVNGYMGYFILMPRYMENHFRQSASGASFFSGTTSILTMIVGIMLGGIVISRFRPRPRFLTGYMTIVSVFGALAMVVSMFIACPSISVVGKFNENGILDLQNDCNRDCGCTTKSFQPVCSSDGRSTYFSPCYAGCMDKIEIPGNSTILKDCICDRPSPQTIVDLVSGYCPFGCTYFLTYIIIMSLSKMIGSTARVASILISLRCVDAADKNASLGGVSAALSAFAFIPYPLIFGALADSTCLVWENKCGKKGNCWIYDVDQLRYKMHGVSFALIIIATVFDGIVCYYSKWIKGELYTDPTDDQSHSNSSQVPLQHMKDTDTQRVTPTKENESVIYTSKENLSNT